MTHLGQIIRDLFDTHQGWFLTALSSLMCIMGSLVIYSDVIIRCFNKRSKFDIKSNEKFLICGFSLSSGSLLFTSFFKLLPKSLDYFQKVTETDDEGAQDDKIKPNLNLMIFFFVGIVAFELLNFVIHYFTSESIVHCNHGGEEHDHGHDHGHEHDHTFEHDLEHSHSHGLSHSHSHSSSSEDIENKSHRSHSHLDEEALIASDEPHYGSSGETNPLVVQQTSVILPKSNEDPAVLAQKKSFFDLAMNKLGRHASSQCIGIEDQNCEGDPNCTDEELTVNVANDIHNLNFYRGLALSKSKSSLVAYTTKPASHNENDFIPVHPSNIRLTTEANLDFHHKHKDDHHHKINTPISKLFSIGLQTCLALSLHKFPEGFITYATSKADPNLGVSIFLSLAIHNIVEGFSMTLPLYLALNSRFKAFMTTFFLGGFSQPVGALLAYLIIGDREIDENESNYAFGVLMSITSGFLSVISLQLFASSISFGGTSSQVIRWCFFGIFIIQLSSTLTDYS